MPSNVHSPMISAWKGMFSDFAFQCANQTQGTQCLCVFCFLQPIFSVNIRTFFLDFCIYWNINKGTGYTNENELNRKADNNNRKTDGRFVHFILTIINFSGSAERIWIRTQVSTTRSSAGSFSILSFSPISVLKCWAIGAGSCRTLSPSNYLVILFLSPSHTLEFWHGTVDAVTKWLPVT